MVNPNLANPNESNILNAFYKNNSYDLGYDKKDAWEARPSVNINNVAQRAVVSNRDYFDTANQLRQNIISKLEKVDPQIATKIGVIHGSGSKSQDAVHRVAFNNDALNTMENYNAQFKEKIAPELATELLNFVVQREGDWKKENVARNLIQMLPELSKPSEVGLWNAVSLAVEFNKEKGDYTLIFNGTEGKKTTITMDIDHLKGVIGIISFQYKDEIKEKNVHDLVTNLLNYFIKDTNNNQQENAARNLYQGPLRELSVHPQPKDVHIREAESVDLVFNKEKGDYTLTFNGKKGRKSTITLDAEKLKALIELLSFIYKKEVKV